MQKLLSVLYRENRENAIAIEKYIGLVGEPMDSLVDSEGKKRSLMFSYKNKATGSDLLEKCNNEEEDVLRIMRAKESNQKKEKENNEEADKAEEERIAKEVRKLQDMDVTIKKQRKEKETRGEDMENEYMLQVWEETAKEASQLIKHKFSKKVWLTYVIRLIN